MNKSIILGVSLSLVGSFGCADFAPGSRVSSFRVLAMQTDAPFAKPGETVNLTTLSYDPQGRAINWAWAVCVNPSASTVDGCLQKIAMDAATSGASPIVAQGDGMDTFSYTIPHDALSSLPPAARPSALVGVLSVACPGELTFDAAASDAPFHCADADTHRELAPDEYVIGLKRISVRATDRNQNPSIEGVVFDGKDWPEGLVPTVSACDTHNNDYDKCPDATKHQVAVQVSADSVESDTSEFGVPFSEQVIIEYYSTEGTFEHEIKIAADPQTGWAARKAASGQDLSMWFVVHDDRGGQTWTSRVVHVE
ncbi:MAG: hypothetical protein ABI488_09440 [Polyangiaceae bacterium]